MFSDNLKRLRTKNGMSQEEAAQKLNIVRQTVSKWEKGISVPDADMILKIAELFKVSASELLDEPLHNAPAKKEKPMSGCLLAFLIVLFLFAASFSFGIIDHIQNDEANLVTTRIIHLTLDGDDYSYSITYDEEGIIVSSGGDELIGDYLEVISTNDAKKVIEQTKDYFTEMGAEVEILSMSGKPL